MDKLITDYEIQLIEPGWAPGAGSWNAIITFSNDISEVFPYINALLTGVNYDHETRTLTWREADQLYALRPREMRISEAKDYQDAHKITGDIIARINQIWCEREQLTPRFTARKFPSALAIFKLLPGNNCRQCGYSTCMAFAADLRQGKASVGGCPLLCQAEYSLAKEKIESLFASA